MQNMPLPCKILKAFSSSTVVDVRTFGVIAKDVVSINPNSNSDKVDFTWVDLSYTDVQVIEAAFRSSKATERFSYNNELYLLEDGYSVNVVANKPIVQASFVRIK